MPESPVVLHLIDGFGVGGAQQRYFNDLEHLGAPFEHWACAVFGDRADAIQGAHLTVPMRTLNARRLAGLPLALGSLARLLHETPRIKLIHTQLFAADTIGRIAGRVRGIPVISTVQSSIYEPGSGLYSRWRHRLDRLTAQSAARIVAVSDFVRGSVHRRLGVPLDKISVLPNTVDTARVAPDPRRRAAARAELELGSGAFAWLNVGRLHAAKGLVELLTAFATLARSHRDSVLMIAGRGPQLGELRARAAFLGIADRVRFLGERADVLALLDASDGFAFPSFSEGLPVSLLEALAMEKPCVASAIGPHMEIIAPGDSGLLVPPRDTNALSHAMAGVQGDAAFARQLGESGRRRVQAAFEARCGARALMDLYTSVCRMECPP